MFFLTHRRSTKKRPRPRSAGRPAAAAAVAATARGAVAAAGAGAGAGRAMALRPPAPEVMARWAMAVQRQGGLSAPSMVEPRPRGGHDAAEPACWARILLRVRG